MYYSITQQILNNFIPNDFGLLKASVTAFYLDTGSVISHTHTGHHYAAYLYRL